MIKLLHKVRGICMKKWLMAVVFGSILVLGACGGGGASDNGNDTGDGATEDVAAAEAIYKDSCASCHGGDLSGGAGPSLETVGADMSADEILDVIENGKGSMPPGLISGDDATAVAEWLADHK